MMIRMDAYTGFAQVYDIFMDETPYREWAEYLSALIQKYGISRPKSRKTQQMQTGQQMQTLPSGTMQQTSRDMGDQAEQSGNTEEALRQERDLVVELGCGTGTLTGLLWELGYDMIGIDNSEEMLAAAIEKREKAGADILYLLQDMRELELYCTSGTMLSVCDSMNYLLEEEDLLKTFRLVHNYLYPGGIFLFDFNTVYKYEQVIGDTTIAENREECSFIWENYYHETEQINEYDLTLFVRQENGMFSRMEETHLQRGYTLETMRRIAEAAGLSFVMAVDADTHQKVREISERIYMIVQKGE